MEHKTLHNSAFGCEFLSLIKYPSWGVRPFIYPTGLYFVRRLLSVFSDSSSDCSLNEYDYELFAKY